ncbi:MAG: heme-copper oxidase subunit III [Anaerolineae bacterium]|nr:heme-copper oxidase subunit III [Anaerolineae bacterium]
MAEAQLSRQELQALRNRRAGLAIFQASWILVFICLIVVNLWMRGLSTAWPPPGVQPLSALLPTALTAMLIISSFTARRGLRAIKADNHAGFVRSWGITLLLAVVFVVGMIFEWVNVPFSGQYSNVFRLMVGFHAVHAIAIAIYMWRVFRQADEYGALNFWPVEGGASLWYFVTVAWMLFYAVLYLI